MQKLVASLLIIASALLAGCATTANIVHSGYRLAQNEKLKLELTAPSTASEKGIAILRQRLTSQLTSNGLLAMATDTSPKTIEVTVTSYYMRYGAARATLGIMAGIDKIQSTVKVKDPASGRVLSEFTVKTKNSTAWGTSRGLIEDHADKVVETLCGMNI